MLQLILKLFCSLIAIILLGYASNVPTGDFIYYDSLNGEPYTVTYDARSFIINGERTLLLGGSVHYPRLSPGQWNDILSKARSDGLNHVEIYVFWNIHEPSYNLSGNHSYNTQGRANLTGFLDAAINNGLFVNLRIGPYVCAEWSFGALPVWLLHVPNIIFRDANEAWEEEMATFVKWVANVAEPYLAKNGGPIILAQIENEYHGNSEEYVSWCGNLAESLNFDIPWVMCNGKSANNTINTCNGNDCYSSYVPTHSSLYHNQPLGWTENEGWFQYWTPTVANQYEANQTGWANRTPQDMAYVVAIWFAAGAAHHNYYMWYGGNHVGWTAGSGISNYYADGVNWHADGLANEPKRSHLNQLHEILAIIQKPMLEDDIQYGNEIYIKPDNYHYYYNDANIIESDSNTFAYFYQSNVSKQENVTFLCNIDELRDYTVTWNGETYDLPSESVSIINNEGMELFNTAKVNLTNLATKRTYKSIYSGNSDLSFESWSEMVPLTNNPQNRTDSSVYHSNPYEQIRFSNNTSEYLYYSVNINTDFSKLDSNSLKIRFEGHFANAYNVWFGSSFLGSVWNGQHSTGSTIYSVAINSSIDCSNSNDNDNDDCVLTILSSNLGIDNYDGVRIGGDAEQQDKKGLSGNISLHDSNTNEKIDDYTDLGWYHWIGTTGENLNVSGAGGNDIAWKNPIETSNAMTWYRTYFVTPDVSMVGENGAVTSSFLLDIGGSGNGLRKGHWWLNGIDMGHYNNAIQYDSAMVQQYYYIPIDYMLSLGNNGLNSLVFQEELPLNGNNDIANVKLVLSTFVIP